MGSNIRGGPDNERVLLKIIVLGASAAGKTSLMRRFVQGDFNPERRATIGADFMTTEMDLGGTSALLQIWDTAGTERFMRGPDGILGQGFYRGASGALLVYDVTRANTFDQVPLWRDEVLERLGPDWGDKSLFPMVVIGNKSDLIGTVRSGGVDMERAKQWCAEVGLGHLETSARTNAGVSAAMSAVAMLALEEKKKRDRILADERQLGGGPGQSRVILGSQLHERVSTWDVDSRGSGGCCG